MTECGREDPVPTGWTTGVEDMETSLTGGWIEGGWLKFGPTLSQDDLDSIGAPIIGASGDLPSVGTTPRGVWGVPNNGISEPNARPGYHIWGGPTWAFAGEYQLCWCKDTRSDAGCTMPEHFKVTVGFLLVTGPQVLPLTAQVHFCARGWRCDIMDFKGTIPGSGQLMIANETCGTDAPAGAPRKGISLPSPDGHLFQWGMDAITTTPGKYRLCWCSNVGFCNFAEDFLSFAGFLQVKAPLSPSNTYFCPLNRPCNITGIYGEGLHSGDKVMVMAACGAGTAPAVFANDGMSSFTSEDGSRFVLPPSTTGGRWRICWCPGEFICIQGIDFVVDLGVLEIGGPDPNFVYDCYEWQPCTIPQLTAMDMHDGDRFVVVYKGTDCGAGNFRTVEGFPGGGVSLPAEGGGYTVSWGSGLVRAPPDVYKLCWCNSVWMQSGNWSGNCSTAGPFSTEGGGLRVRTSAEYQFATRPAEPEKRGSEDSFYAYFLAIPLPLVFCLAVVAGWRRMVARTAGENAAPPSFLKQRGNYASEEQQKTMHMHLIKQVLDTRLKIKALRNAKAEKKAAKPPEVPSFATAQKKPQPPALTMGPSSSHEDMLPELTDISLRTTADSNSKRLVDVEMPASPATGTITTLAKVAQSPESPDSPTTLTRTRRGATAGLVGLPGMPETGEASGVSPDYSDLSPGGMRRAMQGEDQPEPPNISFNLFYNNSRVWELLDGN